MMQKRFFVFLFSDTFLILVRILKTYTQPKIFKNSLNNGMPCYVTGHQMFFYLSVLPTGRHATPLVTVNATNLREYFLPSRISNPAFLPGFQGFPKAGSSTSEGQQVFIQRFNTLSWLNHLFESHLMFKSVFI